MRTASMRTHEILPIRWLVYAEEQVELLGNGVFSHAFKAGEDQILFDPAARNQPVAMVARSYGEHLIGRNRFPKRNIAHGFKPFFHVLNVFKNYHGSSVPDWILPMQIWLKMKEMIDAP